METKKEETSKEQTVKEPEKQKTEQKKAIEFKPTFKMEFVKEIQALPELDNPKTIDVRYKVIDPFVYIHIYWDDKENELTYVVEEPELTAQETKHLAMLQEGLTELINFSFINIKDEKAVMEFLEKNLRVLIDEFSLNVTEEAFPKMMYYAYRDFIGMTKIEGIMRDYYIEDVECNGSQTPIYVVHRKYRNLRTNVIFQTNKDLTSFVEKLAQRCSQYISYANPLLDGVLPDGSLDYNEPFIYKENGIVKISKMGEFIDKFYTAKDSNIPVKVEKIEVPAFDPKTLKITWKKTDYVYRHRTDEELYKLNLEYGRKVTLTGAHSIFKLTKDGIKAEKTCNIKEDDYVAVPLTIPENDCIKEYNLAKELSQSKYCRKFSIEGVPYGIFLEKKDEIKACLNENYKQPYGAYYELRKKSLLPINLWHLVPENILRNCKIKTTSPVKIPTFLTVNKELLMLLGYYISEGWTTNIRAFKKVQLCLHKDETDYIEDIKSCFKKCFSVEPYVEPPYKNAVKITINSLLIWSVFNDVLKVSHYAKQKRIPEIVFNVSRELQREFLIGWHNGDFGSTASPNLANDVSYLSLFDKNIVPFYDRDRTSSIDGRLLKTHEYYTNFLRRDQTNSYSSMIPLEIFNPLNETNNTLKSNKRFNRNRLQKIINGARYKRFENVGQVNSQKFLNEWNKRGFLTGNELTDKGKDLVKELNVVRSLIESDVGFVKVKKIARTKSSKDFVYDVSVKGCENFIGGSGGICCHNSRVNATYTQDISARGPTFTIRKFTTDPWTPIKLMDFRTVSPEILAYLWIAIENKSSIMVIGGTGSGKTSFLNALAFFIPPAARVVSIEDTQELNLKHENWLPSVARAGVGLAGITGEKHGEVTLFDLLRESLRQRPDYIIVGEVRGKEAYVLFQGMATGHPSFGTFHAESVETMIQRLVTPPINLSPSLVEALDIACLVVQTKVKGKEVRRLLNVTEVIKVGEGDTLSVNVPFVRDAATDKFLFKTDSKVFQKIIERVGIPWPQLLLEFQRRTKLLMELYRRKIFGFQEVQDVINRYYKVPDEVLKKFGIP